MSPSIESLKIALILIVLIVVAQAVALIVQGIRSLRQRYAVQAGQYQATRYLSVKIADRSARNHDSKVMA